ncbi:DoxX family protein [Streptomyces triticirhizae]|uniref:DoxX family protein n=1 Tax=Streptomyces triticirhizae TaxID=2483353 RepID=A0A3M2LJ54_9ACTN|nr:DoxX family protein [Streptomyces triticirhizae]RMI37156.1 DoxX family protein [Streptomyces triticirhizae]
MDVLVLIGRILFVLLFLNSAIGHLTQTKGMAQYAGSQGVPFPWLAVFGSGILQLVGGLMVLLGVWADLGALLLFVFLAPTAVMVHRFWREGDQQARQNALIQFLKDLSLAGAALMLFAFFAHTGDDLGLTLTGPLFDID